MGFRDGSRIGTGSLGGEAIIAAMTSCGDEGCQEERGFAIWT